MIRFCHQTERHITVKIVFDQYHTGTSLMSFGLMAKAYHALVGTFASHDEILSLC